MSQSSPDADRILRILFSNDTQTTSVLTSFSTENLYIYLDAHGLPSQTSDATSRGILVHHLLNGLCAVSMTPECQACAGSGSPGALKACVMENVFTRCSKDSTSMAEIRVICSSLGLDKLPHSRKLLIDFLTKVHSMALKPMTLMLTSGAHLSRMEVLRIAAAHGISTCGDANAVFQHVLGHIFDGSCMNSIANDACRALLADAVPVARNRHCLDTYHAYFFNFLGSRLNLKSARALLASRGIAYEPEHTLCQLRAEIAKHGRRLLRYQPCPESDRVAGEWLTRLTKAKEEWPPYVSPNRKDYLSALFRKATSSEALRKLTCASCARAITANETAVLPCQSLNLYPLRHSSCCAPVPLGLQSQSGIQLTVNSSVFEPYDHVRSERDGHQCQSNTFSFPDGPMRHLLLETDGVLQQSDGSINLRICNECLRSLQMSRVPKYALANKLYVGDVPDCLKNLTPIEESIVSLNRAKSWIVQLQENDPACNVPARQRAMRGHTIVYPQDPDVVASILPPTIQDIVTPICVIFVGHKMPSTNWLKEHAVPLIVRADRIRTALVWLKHNNPLYANVRVDDDRIDELDGVDFLPFHVEHVMPSISQDVLQSRYDAPCHSVDIDQTDTWSPTFENIIVANVDCNASSAELRAAAIRHIVEKGGGYLMHPHRSQPVRDFVNPQLFPMLYPTLFPYGVGGVEDVSRITPISFKAHIHYLLSLRDCRFREHHSFMFTAFNIIQRRAVLLHTSLKVRKSDFSSVAAHFATVSLDAVQRVSARVSKGDCITARDDEEKRVLELMKQVNVISCHVPGSAAARMAMRNEIRGMMIHLGLPSFYITLNPADVYNPLVKFLAGTDIDIDALPMNDVPNFREQSLLVARDPVAATLFFHTYINAFVNCLLHYDPAHPSHEGGLFGVTAGYYGCVEAQGRGTLHCHMLIWLEGAWNPNEIKNRVLQSNSDAFQKKIIEFLDDAISTCVPPAPEPQPDVPSSHTHPCTVRGLNSMVPETEVNKAMDLHNVVRACQIHRHGPTCWKYNISPADKECRFNLDSSNFKPISKFDSETGKLDLRCLDGLVNNFNATVLQNMRCNMDIKFIGSGPSAKAILHYITDYISKTQLKVHVAFAALERAVERLGAYNSTIDMPSSRAKSLLQKCAHAMISNQEMSSQQVSSLLLGFDEKFTSHVFRHLYWTNIENYVNELRPSPECYIKEGSSLEKQPAQELQETIQMNSSNDVCLQSDSDTVVRIKPTVVEDYVMRGTELNTLALWDFVAQIDKCRLQSADNTINCENSPVVEVEGHGTMINSETLLFDISRKRPRFSLLSTHSESSTYSHVMRHPLHRFVVVPMGPRFPRRDRDFCLPRYHRLMLLLFCPWRVVEDLAQAEETWTEAFERHLRVGHFSDRIQTMMENIQILHECKDSRDAHWADRRLRRKTFKGMHDDVLERNNVGNESLPHEYCEDDILDHLDSIQNCRTEMDALSQEEIFLCLDNIQKGGLILDPPDDMHDSNSIQLAGEELVCSPSTLELTWRGEFEERREQWKRRNRGTIHISCNEGPTTSVLLPLCHVMNPEDESVPMPPLLMPRLQYGNMSHQTSTLGDIDRVVHRWNLNREQEMCVRIVVQHTCQRTNPDTLPLRMFLSGPAGTGKSRVINALQDWFQSRSEQRRFRVCSYMGIAAKNVSGMTLHSALCIGTRFSGGVKASSDLMALWEGVDTLFIDEVSMLSCRFLCQISKALSKAKGNSMPFGNLNIIFAGDLAQLPPVSEKRLYAHIDTQLSGRTAAGQDIMFGKLLWLSVKTVVFLQKQHRQSGDENEHFVYLLDRLREGRCNDDDVALLFERLLTHIDLNTHPAFATAPIIVAGNAAKDALNERLAQEFAQTSRQALHWYYAEDRKHMRHSNSYDLVETEVQDHLMQLHSGKTRQRLGRIPLVLGMPVLVAQNFDVPGGIVNGSRGFVRRIRYYLNSSQHRVLRSCIVEIPDTDPNPMSGLPPKHYPILPDTISLKFTHPYSKESRTIFRTQLPIVPAFAMTAHRAQGMTLDHVIVDLESCRGTEAPYVMLSRASSLQGVAILRPFAPKRIKCSLSEDARLEKQRLNVLNLLTLAEYGTTSERHAAEDALTRVTHPKSHTLTCFATPQSNVPSMLDCLQDETLELSRLRLNEHAIGIKRISKTQLTSDSKKRRKA